MKIMKKLLLFALCLIFLGLSIFSLQSNATEVKDYETSIYKSAIDKVIEHKIMQGYEDGTFRPEGIITRAEFSVILSRIIGMEESAKKYLVNNVFNDVPSNHWASKFIEIAYSQNLINGYGDSKFGPSDTLTYEQTVKLILNALGYNEYALQKGSYPEGYIIVAQEKGLDKGVENAKLGAYVSRGMLAQIICNSLDLKILQTVNVNNESKFLQRENTNLLETYVQGKEPGNELFKIANTGWDIYKSGGYFYGPSMLINEDGSIDMWASTSGAYGEVDWVRYRRSTDGGKTWTNDSVALRPDPKSLDFIWVCDPGVVKFGEYYYIGYTSKHMRGGGNNNVFVARSKNPGGPYEKWDGKGWGGNPQPIIFYDDKVDVYGAGEPSFVEKDGTLYIYTSWLSVDTSGKAITQTRVYTAPSDDLNWPTKMEYRGIALTRALREDSTDVKYVPAYKKFIAIATAERFQKQSYIHLWSSVDGITFKHEANIKANTMEKIHNGGISSMPNGHIDINAVNYIGYAYVPPTATGNSWGNWWTRFSPISWLGGKYDGKENEMIAFEGPSGVSIPDSDKALNIFSDERYKVVSIGGEGNVKVEALKMDGKRVDITSDKNLVYDYDKEFIDINKETGIIKGKKYGVTKVKLEYQGVLTDFIVTILENRWRGVASESIPNWTVDRLTDRNTATVWSSVPRKDGSVENLWCGIVADKIQKIDGLVLSARAPNGINFPYDFKFQYSLDEVNFIDIPGMKFENFNAPNFSKVEFMFEKPIEAKAIRMIPLKIGRLEPFFQIGEFGVISLEETNKEHLVEFIPEKQVINILYSEELKQLEFIGINNMKDYIYICGDSKIQYSDYDKNIISVDEKGFVKGLKAGETTITVKYDNFTTFVKVIVAVVGTY